MSIEIPESYFIRKFCELGYGAQDDRRNSVFSCSCPICHEGSSFRKKKRCFYIPHKNLIYCHNCGWSSNPVKWIKEITGMNYAEIVEDAKNDEFIPKTRSTEWLVEQMLAKKPTEALPDDSVNLFDERQLGYYSDNSVVRMALNYIAKRRLDTAVNRPHAFYVSLCEGIHKGRLIIPFCDWHGKIVYYQSRAFGGTHSEKMEKINYLSKKDTPKTIFGVERVDDEIEEVYVLEGPIDACFVKNGIAIAGITLSGPLFCESQMSQVRALSLEHKFVWVLDNQWIDSAARVRTEYLINKGESVFFWPKELSAYKDVNEYCVSKGLDEFPRSIIEENVISGETGRMSFLLQMSLHQQPAT